MAKGAIYTIGYARLTPVRLREIMDLLRIGELMDCRSSPRTRVRGFGNRQLAAFFGEQRYTWRGDKLGGRSAIDRASVCGIQWAAEDGERVMLMCMEESPGDCHRHHAIAVPLINLGARVLHVYRNEVVDAIELQRAIDDDKYFYKSENLYKHAAREVDTLRAQLQRLKGER